MKLGIEQLIKHSPMVIGIKNLYKTEKISTNAFKGVSRTNQSHKKILYLEHTNI